MNKLEDAMQKYVIFDVDGTLNRTDLYAVEAYEKALAKRNIQVEESKIISCIGLSPMAIIEKLLGKLDKEEIVSWRNDIKEYEFDLMKEKACAFDGIEKVLIKLKEDKFGLAICSNAFLDHIKHVLTSIGLLDYFDIIGSLEMGKDKGEVLKNLLERLGNVQACMVGDRKFDIQAARLNNIPVIGCAYGYAPEEIQEAEVVVKDPYEIYNAVKQLI